MKTKHRGWIHILLLIIPFFLIVGLVQLAGYWAAGYDITAVGEIKSPTFRVYSSFLELTGTLIVLWLFMRFVDKLPFIELGFQTKDRLKEFFIGVLAGGIIMMTGFLILIASLS